MYFHVCEPYNYIRTHAHFNTELQFVCFINNVKKIWSTYFVSYIIYCDELNVYKLSKYYYFIIIVYTPPTRKNIFHV